MILFLICLEEIILVVLGHRQQDNWEKEGLMTRKCSSHYTLYISLLTWVWWHTRSHHLRGRGQAGLHSEFQASQKYIADLTPTATIRNKQTNKKIHLCFPEYMSDQANKPRYLQVLHTESSSPLNNGSRLCFIEKNMQGLESQEELYLP